LTTAPGHCARTVGNTAPVEVGLPDRRDVSTSPPQVRDADSCIRFLVESFVRSGVAVDDPGQWLRMAGADRAELRPPATMTAPEQQKKQTLSAVCRKHARPRSTTAIAERFGDEMLSAPPASARCALWLETPFPVPSFDADVEIVGRKRCAHAKHDSAHVNGQRFSPSRRPGTCLGDGALAVSRY
jgi:hypothetical protein